MTNTKTSERLVTKPAATPMTTEQRTALEVTYSNRMEGIEAQLRAAIDEATRLGLPTTGMREALGILSDPGKAGAGMALEKVEQRRVSAESLRALIKSHMVPGSQKRSLALVQLLEETA